MVVVVGGASHTHTISAGGLDDIIWVLVLGSFHCAEKWREDKRGKN